MLCDNQQCSYSHWILHANYDIKSTIHNGNKFSRNQDKRLYDKQKVVTSCPISKISINYAYPKQELLDKNFKNKMKKKKTSQECILIPKDPTSPYAFTENGFSFNKPKKNKFLVNQDQACCVVIFFLVICTVSMLVVIIYLSQCTHAMTSGMT